MDINQHIRENYTNKLLCNRCKAKLDKKREKLEHKDRNPDEAQIMPCGKCRSKIALATTNDPIIKEALKKK